MQELATILVFQNCNQGHCVLCLSHCRLEIFFGENTKVKECVVLQCSNLQNMINLVSKL